jgi:protein involved in polysaccharide export with SLBB domain
MQTPQLMKLQNVRILSLVLLLITPLLALGLAGCATPDYTKEMEAPAGATNAMNLPPLVVGDTVLIQFDGPPTQLPPQEKPITDDGTITLPDIGRIQAAGKTPGELENDIQNRYVPAIYTHLTVTVKRTSDAVYYVRGEVKGPGRMIYTGPITVSKAITSAGDFNDFANHKNVYLIRTNGQRFKLNLDKILNGDAPDPPVFPGDQIEVKRRVF